MDNNMKRNSIIFVIMMLLSDALHAQSVAPSMLEYWFDTNYAGRKTVSISEESIHTIDVSQLCSGVHNISMRIADTKGQWSAPLMRYFIKPDLHAGAELISAYEYWFNNGPRKRVELTPATTVELNNVVIDVTDVIPHYIPDDYTFDTSDEMVGVKDDVCFGLQVFNAEGSGSLAVMSDTFTMQVPVNPHFVVLNNSEQQTVLSPTQGQMQGFKTTASAGEQLTYTVSTQALKAEFYDAEGNRLAVGRENLDTGECRFTVQPDATGTVYMLVYDVPVAYAEITAALTILPPSAIQTATTHNTISVDKNLVVVESDKESKVRIISTTGEVVVNQALSNGRSSFLLQPGVYIIAIDGRETQKVLIP